ncbi:MAG: hypothetical protein AVDCRST_MAG10-747, partial [uncultured Acidimicrobiales bacterium]
VPGRRGPWCPPGPDPDDPPPLHSVDAPLPSGEATPYLLV